MLFHITLFLLDLVSIADSCPNQSLQDDYFPIPPLALYHLAFYTKEELCFSWALVYFTDLMDFPILPSGL